MKIFRATAFVPFIVLAITACGNLQSKVLTADLLKTGSPSLYVATLPFMNNTAVGSTDTEVFPIVNQGFRDGSITAITFTDTHFTLNAGSECKVGTSILRGSSCNISIDFTPTIAGAVSGNMHILYSGNGGPFDALYPLAGTGH